MSEIDNLINTLCVKLGVATEWFLPRWIEWCQINIVTDTILYVLVMTVSIIIAVKTLQFGNKKCCETWQWNDPDNSLPLILIIISTGITGLIMGIYAIISIKSLILAFASPEMYAIQRLLGMLRGS